MKTTLKGEVSVKTQGYIHTGSEFSRHPEGLSFSGLRSEFSRSEFSSHPHCRSEYISESCLLMESGMFFRIDGG